MIGRKRKDEPVKEPQAVSAPIEPPVRSVAAPVIQRRHVGVQATIRDINREGLGLRVNVELVGLAQEPEMHTLYFPDGAGTTRDAVWTKVSNLAYDHGEVARAQRELQELRDQHVEV